MKLILTFLLLASTTLFSEIIPPDRRIDWSPGIPGGYPEKIVEVDVMDHGAIGDGLTDDSNAFIDAIKAIPEAGGALFIPEGTYLIKNELVVTKGVLFRGEGFDKTRLLFDLGERRENCIKFVKYDRGDWIEVLEGYAKGSRELVVQNSALFQVDDYVEIQQENDSSLMYTKPEWNVQYAQNAVGQIAKIESIKNDSTLVLNRPLYITYNAELLPQIRTINMVEYPGVEDLYIERLDAGAGDNIQMRYVVYGRVQRIESNMTYQRHLYLGEVYACEVRNNYMHHAHDYGDGGHGYGVQAIRHTSDCLIIDNVFQHLRHSIVVSIGASGNVFACNFSTERDPQRFLCDLSLHGFYCNANLFESNVVEEIDISDYWGPVGPGNTLLRNVITHEDVDINDSSHGQNLVGNVFRKGLVKISSSVKETLMHGNVVAGTAYWNPAIEDHNVPVSYFLTEKPDFLANSPWPLFGPDVEGDHQLPAQIRYESGNPITGVKEHLAQTPNDYRLAVYPNPFNPQTTISFDLQQTGHVRIEVYSALGQVVEVLVDGIMPAGRKAVSYQPSTFSASGIYIVRITTESSVLNRKVMFLK